MNLNISMELAGKLAGQTPENLRAALFEGDGDELTLKNDAEETFRNFVFDKFKEAERDKVKGEVGRALRERMEGLEKVIKPIFEKYEISADKLEDGLSELSEKIPGEPGKPGKSQELTPDQIKKLPAYQNLLDEHLSKIKGERDDWEQKYTQFVDQTKRDKVVSVAREKALSVLDGQNAAWGDNKSQQLEFFFKAIGTDVLSLDDDGNLSLVDKDGTPLRDDSKNRITYENWILQNWKSAGFTFNEAPPGSSSAGAKRSGSGSGGSSIVIKDRNHYDELMNKAAGFEERSKIRTAWREKLESED